MQVIYVDDEQLQLTNFRLTADGMPHIGHLETFDSGENALAWAQSHVVDLAFLDIEMLGMNGLELAKRLKEKDENICIVFVTAYEQYALQAFGVDAIGYLLKPYAAADIEKHITRAYYLRQIQKRRIRIRTMPELAVAVNGSPVMLGHNKPEELLALLIDRGAAGLTKKDAIDALWQGYSSDSSYWTTMARLKKVLDEAGAADLILTRGQTKYLNTGIVTCDLYQMLQGDDAAIANYHGAYLAQYYAQYAWVRSRTAQLDRIKEAAQAAGIQHENNKEI